MPLVFLDFETTGLSFRRDSVCEVGAVKVYSNHLEEEFQTLINPKIPIPVSSSEIHGIFDKDVIGAPFFEDVADDFLRFIRGSVICGYNVNFDLNFLFKELMRINKKTFEVLSIDVLSMARSAIKGLPRYNLIFLTNHLQIKAQRFHRALDDACATKDIFFKIKGDYFKGNTKQVKAFISKYDCELDLT
jgi:DNA polymerase-3 subunit alpha (Gram-positive type)